MAKLPSIIKNKNIILVVGLSSICALILASVFVLTEENIAKNEFTYMQGLLKILTENAKYDNDILASAINLETLNNLKPEIINKIYIGCWQQKPNFRIFNVTAPYAYNGSIDLLIGINDKQQITGVQVTKHQETPGLGDKITPENSNWLEQFKQKSWRPKQAANWRVNKDGGEFTQFTGATVTPRAVVNAISKVAEYAYKNPMSDNNVYKETCESIKLIQ